MSRANPKTLLFLGLLMAGPAPAMAAPAEVASVIHAAAPYGTGKYAVLFITAYDTELWTDAAQWSMNAPFALTLRYHIGFSSSYLLNRTLREMKGVDPKLSDADIERYKKAMAFFARILRRRDEHAVPAGRAGAVFQEWRIHRRSVRTRLRPGFLRRLAVAQHLRPRSAQVAA